MTGARALFDLTAARLPAEKILSPHLKLDEPTLTPAWNAATTLIRDLPLQRLRGEPLTPAQTFHPLHAALVGLATLLQSPREEERATLHEAAWAMVCAQPLHARGDLTDAAWSALGLWAATLPGPQLPEPNQARDWRLWRSAVSHTPAVAEVLATLWTCVELITTSASPTISTEWRAALTPTRQTLRGALKQLGVACPPETLRGLLRPLVCSAQAMKQTVPQWLRASGLLDADDAETAAWLMAISRGETISWAPASVVVPPTLSAAALNLNDRCSRPLSLTGLRPHPGRARIQQDVPWMGGSGLRADEAPPSPGLPWEALQTAAGALALNRAHPEPELVPALQRELVRINQHDAALLYGLLTGADLNARQQFQITRLIVWWNAQLTARRLTLPQPSDAGLLEAAVQQLWTRLGDSDVDHMGPEDQLRQLWGQQELARLTPAWPGAAPLTGEHPRHDALLTLLEWSRLNAPQRHSETRPEN